MSEGAVFFLLCGNPLFRSRLFPQRSAFSVFAAVEFPWLYQENKKTEAGQKLRSKRNGAASKASCRRKYVKAAIGGKGRTQGAPSADIFSILLREPTVEFSNFSIYITPRSFES